MKAKYWIEMDFKIEKRVTRDMSKTDKLYIYVKNDPNRWYKGEWRKKRVSEYGFAGIERRTQKLKVYEELLRKGKIRFRDLPEGAPLGRYYSRR